MYATKLGHAHIKVRELDRAVAFYREFLGLVVTERVRDSYALLASPGNGAHHEIALQDVGPLAPAPPSRATGLYHVAFEVEDARSLAEADEALARASPSSRSTTASAGRCTSPTPTATGSRPTWTPGASRAARGCGAGAPCPSPGRSCWRGSRRNPGRRPPSHRSADGSREGQASTRSKEAAPLASAARAGPPPCARARTPSPRARRSANPAGASERPEASYSISPLRTSPGGQEVRAVRRAGAESPCRR